VISLSELVEKLLASIEERFVNTVGRFLAELPSEVAQRTYDTVVPDDIRFAEDNILIGLWVWFVEGEE